MPVDPSLPVVPLLAVFDVDGTLSDTRHRDHHLRGRRDWAAFFAGAGADPVLPEGEAAVRAAEQAGCTIVYLSGRPETLRATTLKWLQDNDFPAGDLLLRRAGDRRPAPEVKIEALRRLSRGRPVALLVDDDQAVLARVRALRPPIVTQVLHADWQPAEPSPALTTRRRTE